MHSASGQEGESVKPKQLHCTTDGHRIPVLAQSNGGRLRRSSDYADAELRAKPWRSPCQLPPSPLLAQAF
ncbi:hypothetical protein QQF64_002125, partial [Cirrhinus molitorella]